MISCCQPVTLHSLNYCQTPMHDVKNRLPAKLIDSLNKQLRRVQQLRSIGLIERRLSQRGQSEIAALPLKS